MESENPVSKRRREIGEKGKGKKLQIMEKSPVRRLQKKRSNLNPLTISSGKLKPRR